MTEDTLEYNNGDQLVVDLKDTKNGLQVVIKDLTTGESGSMTASTANGFGHALFQPNAHSCTFRPYAFHPMYSTSSESTRVLWAAHGYNVAYSDEIGHFEYCNAIDSRFRGTSGDSEPTGPNPSDNTSCFPADVVSPAGATLESSFIGCLAPDSDFDGPSYQQANWPGGIGADPAKVPTPVVFSSPLFAGGGKGGKGKFNNEYQRIAFENDLPRIEGSDFSNNTCERHVTNPTDPPPGPGSGCVNPPNGATLYPTFSTFTGPNGQCLWEEGGGSFANATNNFGGTSTAQYGGLLLLNYPVGGPSVSQRYNDFRNTLSNNPCPAGGKGGPKH